jgi:hypothetical protein
MLDGLDHKGWAALEYANDVLSHHSIEVPITDELARSYLDQLRALIDEIAKDDELSSQDRSRIVGLLRKVEEALLDVKIIGTLPMQDAAAAAAAMAQAPGIRERIMGKTWVEAFLTTVRGIVIILQGADSGMAIAQDVQKMITG